MGGAFVSGRLAGRITGTKQIAIGYTLALAGGALSVMLHAFVDSPPIFLQQVLITVVAIGVQLMMPISRCACWTCFRTCAGLRRRCSRA